MFASFIKVVIMKLECFSVMKKIFKILRLVKKDY